MPDLSATAALAPLIDRALEELTDDDPELALHLRALALFAMLGDPDPDPDRMATVARDVALLRGDTVGEARVLAVYVFQRARSGTAEEIGGLAERAARQAHALDAAGADMESGGVVMGLRWADRLEAAECVLLDAIALARRQGSGPHFAFASMNLSEVRRRRGMLREAEADARRHRRRERLDRGAARGGAGRLPARPGARRRGLGGAGHGRLEWTDRPGAAIHLLMVRMRVRAAAGERALAAADWHEALRRPIQGTPAASWIENQLVVADFLRAGADASAARRLAADTVEVLREAVDLLERSPARLVHAQALIDLGAALRRRGDRREGRGPLRDGLALAEGCGADGLAERARGELAASGLRVQRQARGAAGLLTASERRIADLAIAGTSNAEIAQGLFVTLKTVEMHLTNAYRKLGIAKRAELERALG